MGLCYEKSAKRNRAAGVTDRQMRIDLFTMKVFSIFHPKATERLFIEPFWFCHDALAVISHKDRALLLCAFQRNSLGLRTK